MAKEKSSLGNLLEILFEEKKHIIAIIKDACKF
jgi:hypothetical protein